MESLPRELRPEQFSSLVDVLDAIVDRHASLPAFSCLGGTLSYGEIDELSRRFATWLIEQTDLQPGDRLAVQLPNLLQFPVVVYGALRAGLVVVNANPLYTPPEMLHQYKDSAVRAIVILDAMASKLEGILSETRIEHVIVTRLGDLQSNWRRPLLNFAARHVKRMVPAYRLPGAVEFMAAIRSSRPLAESVRARGGDELALLLYSGGTTGVAKGVMLSHRNLIANMMQLRARCLLIIDDKIETIGAPLPMYHSYAFLLHALIMPFAGNHNILIPDPRNIQDVIRQWQKYRFSGFVGINTLYLALLRHPSFSRLDFTSLKFCGAGGMAMSSSVMTNWRDLTGCEIFEGYGLTECSPVVAVNFPGRAKPGTVGPLLPETEVRIVDEVGREVAQGDRGEAWVRGSQVMLGYLNNPVATRLAMNEDGWFKTGDYLEIDSDGFLRIVDRKKDMILVSGFNVFPNEIEEWVNSHPGIAESAAIGIPSERTGEAVKLFVVRQDNTIDEQSVLDHCKSGLTAYKIPQQVVFVEDLPKSNIGKILRRELRD